MSYVIPNVLEDTGKGERSWDIYSRLLNDRIILIGTEINDTISNLIVAQLIYLQSSDPKKPIHLYLNSPGGLISAGLAIYDTMQYIKCEINTYVIGLAASMAALLVCAGAKGKRYALPHSRMMLHQPHGGVGGTAQDIEIQANEIIYQKKVLANLMALHTGKSVETIVQDCDRDFYLSPEEAIAYGLLDQVLNPSSEKLSILTAHQ